MISEWELAEMRRHAEAEYPRECCGVVLATPRRRLVRCANLQQSGIAYTLDPRGILHDLRSGSTITAIYHSHPEGEAIFSDTDRHHALVDGIPAYPEATYVVLSVLLGRADGIGLFRWSPQQRDFLPVAA